MGKPLNLLNKRFGRLLVIRQIQERDKYRFVLWECLCDCGNKIVLRGNTLKWGLTQSCGCYHLERLKDKENEKNVNWKGDDVNKIALHDWVRRRKIKPEFCERCGKEPPRDLSNVSGEYHRDINDFEWLCRRCHMKYDGREYLMNNKGEFQGCSRN
jgi:hypothetical protein